MTGECVTMTSNAEGQRTNCWWITAGSLQFKIPMDQSLSLYTDAKVQLSPILIFFPSFLNCCLSGLCLYMKTRRSQLHILKGTSDRSDTAKPMKFLPALYTDPSVPHSSTKGEMCKGISKRNQQQYLNTNESSTTSSPWGYRMSLVFCDVGLHLL